MVSTLQHADWTAAAVFLLIILGFAGAARRGWQAPDALYRHYQTNRAKTKASIDTDHILPELARLVADVNSDVSATLRAAKSLTLQTLREALTNDQALIDNLQWAGYRDRLDPLSQLYGDYGLLDRLYDSAVTWARRGALCSGVAALALLVVSIPVVFSNISVPDLALNGATGLLVVSATGWAIGLVLEMGQRNRLGRLFRKYE